MFFAVVLAHTPNITTTVCKVLGLPTIKPWRINVIAFKYSYVISWPLRQRDIFEMVVGFFLVYFLFFLFSPCLLSIILVLKYTIMDGISILIDYNCVII